MEVNQGSQCIKGNTASLDTELSILSKYFKATNLLNPQQKEELDKYEEIIETGFERYSTY